jgi:hypothetical protein
MDGMRAEGNVGIGDVGGGGDGTQRKVAFDDDAGVRVSGLSDGGRIMACPAACSTQHYTGGRKYKRSGAVKYAWGELYSSAGATGVERTGREGIDGVLNGGSVVSPRRREVDLCRNRGKSDAACVVAGERVVGNRGAALIAAIDKVPFGSRMDPLVLLREQRGREEQQGSGAKRFHTNHPTFYGSSFGDSCKTGF